MRNTRHTGRWLAMAAAVLLTLGLFGLEARADEVVRLNQEANLRARPGERAPTLAVLDEGQTVRVIGKSGRWIKVKYKGKVGWLTRTQVDEDDDTQARPAAEKKKRQNSGAKARKGGWDSMDDDAVGEDAVEGDEEMEAEADEEDEDAEVKPKKKAKKVAKAAPKKKVKKPAKAKKVAKKAELSKGDEITLTKTTSVREKPSKKGDELWEAEEGTAMTVVSISEDGSWVKVSDEEGSKGWVASRDVAMAGGDDEDIDSDDEEMESDDDDPEPRKVKKSRKNKKGMKNGVAMWAHANVGILSKSQAYTSAGTGLRANYALANTAPAVIAGAGYERDMGGYKLGLTGDAMITVGGSGITIAGAGGGMGGAVLAWKALDLDVHAYLGYTWDKKKGYTFQARAGYHASSVTVDVDDTAKLPSERLSGIMVGAAIVLPGITPKVNVMLGADYLVSGALEQTVNLEDGDTSTVQAFYVGAVGTYKLNAKADMHASYSLNYEGFGFAGANTREPTATGAARKDTQHVLGVGLAYAF